MKRLFILSLFLTFFVGCKDDRSKTGNNFDAEVRLSAAIVQTKASQDQIAFAASDPIAVWIGHNTKALQDRYNFVDKAEFSYDIKSNEFVVNAGQSKITYPKTDSKLNFWAVYPLSLAPTEFASGKFVWTLKGDQSATGYRSSDLMTAQNTADNVNGAKAALKFYHRMGRALINLNTIPATYKGMPFSKVDVFVVSADKALVTMAASGDDDIATLGAVAPNTGSANIEVVPNLYDGVATDLKAKKYEAIICPKTYKAGEPLAIVRVTYGTSTFDMQYTMAADKEVKSGHAVVLNVNVSPSLEITAEFTLKDWNGWSDSSTNGGLKPTV